MPSLTATEPVAHVAPEPGPPRARHRMSNVALGVAAAVLVVLGATVGYGFVATRPEKYAARAELTYDVSGATSSAAVQQRMQTAALVVGNRTVLAEVAEEHGITPDELDGSTAVSLVGQSGVIAVTIERSSSAEALAIAQSVADAGLEALERADPDPRRAILEEGLADLRSEMDEVTAVLASGDPASGALVAAQLRYEQLVEQLAAYESRLVELRLEEASFDRPSLLAPAYELGSVSPHPLSGLAAGTLAGLFLAMTLVAVVWQLRVRSAGS